MMLFTEDFSEIMYCMDKGKKREATTSSMDSMNTVPKR